MYYNDYNRPQEPWGPEPTGNPYPAPSQPPEKKERPGLKIAALCLVCALVGGIAGGAGMGFATGAIGGGGSTTIYESGRIPSVVNVATIKGHKALSLAEIYASNVGSTVGIQVETITANVFGQAVSGASAGSGFVISTDGYILTNYHVIDGAKSIQVSFSSGEKYEAKLVGGEEENDIAVLKIQATDLTPVLIGDSDKVNVGEQVAVIGNPLGELTWSQTAGYISARDRSIAMSDGTVMNVLQTDAAINSGNSGGPLFNIYGEVIGIVNAKYSNNGSGSASIEGIGFAIPINDVKNMVTDIIEHGYITGKPYMGVTVATVTQSDAQRYGMTIGAYVNSVVEGSPAAQAGLQQGDIITKMGDTPVTTAAELIAAKKNHSADDSTTLTVDRNGKIATLTMTFGEEIPGEDSPVEEQPASDAQGGQPYSYNPFGSFTPWGF